MTQRQASCSPTLMKTQRTVRRLPGGWLRMGGALQSFGKAWKGKVPQQGALLESELVPSGICVRPAQQTVGFGGFGPASPLAMWVQRCYWDHRRGASPWSRPASCVVQVVGVLGGIFCSAGTTSMGNAAGPDLLAAGHECSFRPLQQAYCLPVFEYRHRYGAAQQSLSAHSGTKGAPKLVHRSSSGAEARHASASTAVCIVV